MDEFYNKDSLSMYYFNYKILLRMHYLIVTLRGARNKSREKIQNGSVAESKKVG